MPCLRLDRPPVVLALPCSSLHVRVASDGGWQGSRGLRISPRHTQRALLLCATGGSEAQLERRALPSRENGDWVTVRVG